jgi:hypothetical protein
MTDIDNDDGTFLSYDMLSGADDEQQPTTTATAAAALKTAVGGSCKFMIAENGGVGPAAANPLTESMIVHVEQPSSDEECCAHQAAAGVANSSEPPPPPLKEQAAFTSFEVFFLNF